MRRSSYLILLVLLVCHADQGALYMFLLPLVPGEREFSLDAH